MRVLYLARKKPARCNLIKLCEQDDVCQFTNLLKAGKNKDAVKLLMQKGIIKYDMAYLEALKVRADVVITEENVHWDVT